MDSTLERAWRTTKPPFDGRTLFLLRPAPLSDLLALLIQIASALRTQYPAANLRKVADWHEHDGVVLESSSTSWEQINDILSSVSAFSKAVSDDDYVRLGIYDVAGHFYLRLGFAQSALPEGAGSTVGTFDLSAPANVCEVIGPLLFAVQTDWVSAKAFFDERYAGIANT